MHEPFQSPDHLRHFGISTASALREAGYSSAGDQLEEAVRHVTGSGWEWLGYVGAAAQEILAEHTLPPSLAKSLTRVRGACRSEKPYG